MRHMYLLASFCGDGPQLYARPPREIIESFSRGEGVKGVTQFTTSGTISTSWLECDDVSYVWVRVTHPYDSDDVLFRDGLAARLAHMVALEADAALPDAMTAITGAGHI